MKEHTETHEEHNDLV